MERVVILIDMDAFYCQVEEGLNPSLKDQPIAVVQYNAWQGGGIIAVNYPARDAGVTRHMRGKEAKHKCPEIQLVQVPELRGKADLAKYRDAGQKVADVLASFTPLLQRASVDEAYLDVTEMARHKISHEFESLVLTNLKNTYVVGSDIGDFVEVTRASKEFSDGDLLLLAGGVICEEIRLKVFTETGYKCSAGIAHNKILAKLVCALHKPNKQTILPHRAIAKFFETTKITKIRSLGGKFGERLIKDFNITFMAELAKLPESVLAQKYDEKTANFLARIAQGVDLEPVTTKLLSKSIVSCKNFPGRSALKARGDLLHWLGELAAEVVERLEKDLKENRREAKQLIVSFTQETQGEDVSSSRTIRLPGYEAGKIIKSALEVLERYCQKSDGSFNVKFLGLNASNFEDVKNIRKITAFFGGKPEKSRDNEEQNIPGTANLTAEPRPESAVEDSVFEQLTQELDEKETDYVFYPEETEAPETKSFFLKYFRDKAASEVTAKKTVKCPNCTEEIEENELQSHQDYHLAVKMSENEARVPTPPTKRKAGVMDSFLSRQDAQSDSIVTETCLECQKKIAIIDLESHADYHIAKKLHLELNARPAAKPPPKKVKGKGAGCRSLASFFKPSSS